MLENHEKEEIKSREKKDIILAQMIQLCAVDLYKKKKEKKKRRHVSLRQYDGRRILMDIICWRNVETLFQSIRKRLVAKSGRA